jgi:hypothetical protein
MFLVSQHYTSTKAADSKSTNIVLQKIRPSPPEVGNITSKRNSVTRYRLSHVIRAITIKSDNVSYEPTAITIRSDNGFQKPESDDYEKR